MAAHEKSDSQTGPPDPSGPEKCAALWAYASPKGPLCFRTRWLIAGPAARPEFSLAIGSSEIARLGLRPKRWLDRQPRSRI